MPLKRMYRDILQRFKNDWAKNKLGKMFVIELFAKMFVSHKYQVLFHYFFLNNFAISMLKKKQ